MMLSQGRGVGGGGGAVCGGPPTHPFTPVSPIVTDSRGVLAVRRIR